MPIVNKGNVSEGILGCALIAKFAARSGDKIRKISATDVQAAWKKLKSNKIRHSIKQYQEHVYDLNHAATDSIRIIVRLGEQTAKDLFAEKTLTTMRNIVASACAYVNSKPIEAQAMEFFTNLVEDKIEIEVDGISSNTTSKADILIKDNEVTVSRLSVKSGIRNQKMGQVYGDTFGTFVRLFHGGKNLKSGAMEPGLGVPINTPHIMQKYEALRGPERTKEGLQKATAYVYQEAAKLLSSSNTNQFIESVTKFLFFHASRHDEDIRVVVLEDIVKGRYKVMNPALLKDALHSLKSISAAYKPGAWPAILIYSGGTTPTTYRNPNVLFMVTAVFDQSRNKFTNSVEKGPLLEHLITEQQEEDES